MPDRSARAAGLAPWLVAAGCLVVGLALAQPFVDAAVSFDTQANVVYFDRLVGSARLEQQLSTTPKPFLTLVDGLLYRLTGDWRPLVWATLLVHAAAAAMAVVLARRAAGVTAGVLVGLAVAGAPLLIEDAGLGNAVPWAVAGWLLAWLLATGTRPRPVAAGAVLLLAALCRLETLVIVAAVGAALGWARWGPWWLPGPRPVVAARSWWLVILPFGALPVMLVHDALLIGDPLFWLKVSQRYSDAVRESRDILGPLERFGWLLRRYARWWPYAGLAIVGLGILVRSRRWGELAAVIGAGGGIAAFLVLLAARGIYAPERYAVPIDVAVLVLAAVGFAGLVTAAANRLAAGPDARRRWAIVALAIVAGGTAIVASRGGPADPGVARALTSIRTMNENAGRMLPQIAPLTASGADQPHVAVVVPTAVRLRSAIELGLPLDRVGGLSLAYLDPSGDDLAAGQLVFHDRAGDVPVGDYGALESGSRIEIGDLALEPIDADPDHGAWLLRVFARP
ncbi:MAG: hypothetical protein EPO36_07155 [Chloroflexota bacterium]|nr:MAG: hypothetical protein EPO36_07155 [Chloroflexota bacterium]